LRFKPDFRYLCHRLQSAHIVG